MPARMLHDYDPDSDQDEADWLAGEYDAGWIPEYGYGVPVRVGGKLLHRYAMIRDDEGEPDGSKPAPRASPGGPG